MVLQTTVFSNTKNTLQENRQSGKRYQRRTTFIVIRWDKKGKDKDTYMPISNSQSCFKNEYLMERLARRVGGDGCFNSCAPNAVLSPTYTVRALSGETRSGSKEDYGHL
jgi:hypothetical protein